MLARALAGWERGRVSGVGPQAGKLGTHLDLRRWNHIHNASTPCDATSSQKSGRLSRLGFRLSTHLPASAPSRPPLDLAAAATRKREGLGQQFELQCLCQWNFFPLFVVFFPLCSSQGWQIWSNKERIDTCFLCICIPFTLTMGARNW